MTDHRYPTDTELAQLISETEEWDLVQAPPDLLENVLKRADLSAGTAKTHNSAGNLGRKRKDFRNYCIRVIAACAAAIALVFTLPGILNSIRIPQGRPETASISGKHETHLETIRDRQNYSVSNEFISAIGNSRQICTYFDNPKYD